MTEEINSGYEEWFFQADYDFETADAMFQADRYIYSVFMCHLSIEKTLKGLLLKKHNDFPPKIHNLVYFIERLQLKLSDKDLEFVFTLNKASIPTRYPEDLKKLLSVFTQARTRSIVEQTRQLLQWLKQQ